MDRNLYDYLPPFLHTVHELMAIMNAEQPEFEDLWQATDDTLAERFVDSETAYGVARWEAILQIVPKQTDTLDDRKARIKQRIGMILPYTLLWLKQSLAAQYGETKYSAYVDKYMLYVAVNPKEEDDVLTLLNLAESLQEIKPANIILRAAFRFAYSLVIGKVLSTYKSDTVFCGELVCGTYPDIATLGARYSTAASIAAAILNYSSGAAVCGAVTCGE